MNLFNRMVLTGAVAALTALLSACQHPAAPAENTLANLCEPQRTPGSAACQWSETMQQQLSRAFHDAAHYAGQQCLVRLEWQAGGRYAVTQTQGDEALCLRAWQLIGQARQLPPPPEPDQPAWFGFAPHRASLPAPPAATGAG